MCSEYDRVITTLPSMLEKIVWMPLWTLLSVGGSDSCIKFWVIFRLQGINFHMQLKSEFMLLQLKRKSPKTVENGNFVILCVPSAHFNNVCLVLDFWLLVIVLCA